MFCLSSGDIYLYLGFSLLSSFGNISKLFCCEVFEIFVILSAMVLRIKSPAISTVEAFLNASVADSLARSKIF